MCHIYWFKLHEIHRVKIKKEMETYVIVSKISITSENNNAIANFLLISYTVIITIIILHFFLSDADTIIWW